MGLFSLLWSGAGATEIFRDLSLISLPREGGV